MYFRPSKGTLCLNCRTTVDLTVSRTDGHLCDVGSGKSVLLGSLGSCKNSPTDINGLVVTNTNTKGYKNVSVSGHANSLCVAGVKAGRVVGCIGSH